MSTQDELAGLSEAVRAERARACALARETLRDAFAMAALQGLLASGPNDCDEHGIAHDAWLLADAMMQARENSHAD